VTDHGLGGFQGFPGAAAALVIARIGSPGSSRTYAIPGAEVRRVVADLRSQAGARK
jgi:hypothetical protein